MKATRGSREIPTSKIVATDLQRTSRTARTSSSQRCPPELALALAPLLPRAAGVPSAESGA